MKSFRSMIILLVGLFSILQVQSQTVDELIDKHIQAMGGKEKLATLKSVRTEGNLSIMGMDIPVVITELHNVGRRVDVSAMGMDGYVIATPTAGWQYMPFQGHTQAEPLPEEEVKDGADDYDLHGRFVDYKIKGHQAEYLGKETIEGVELHKIKFITKSGKTSTIFLDPNTYFISRVMSTSKAGGQEQERVMNLSNYKKSEEGFMHPHSVTGMFGQGDFTISKIEINKPVDEKIFKPTN